jgi:trehalase-like protein
VFASLLDAERGGFYRIAPDRDDYVTRQLYLPDTAVLITRFMTPDGVGEVHDFMPVIEGPATERHRLVRNIRVVRRVMRFAIELQPRFGYGRNPHQVEITEHGAVFRPEGLELMVHGIAPEGTAVKDAGITRLPDSDGPRWTRTLREGESGEWCWSRWVASRAWSPPVRPSAWRMRPRDSGVRGCTGPRTPAGGGRWSPARP